MSNKFYPHLFSPGKLGRRTTKNRIVMAPMSDNMANADGSMSEQAIAYFSERAKGGVGVILVGIVSVEYPRGKGLSNAHTLDGEKYVKDWERLARNVHRYGALLIPQIQHSGQNTWLGATDGMKPFRVSPEPEGQETGDFHVLTKEDIKMLEQKFIAAAINAQMAGCDGVEVHAATTYLLSQFISPEKNTRTDEYGGSIENRTRLARDIIKGIRAACGPDFIIGSRIPVHKWESDMLSDEESIEIAKLFEEAGVDYLNLNVGYPPNTSSAYETGRYQEGARLDLPKKIKSHVNVPVMAVGLLKDPGMCDEAIGDGTTDFVVIGRSLIADPYWAEKARKGRANEIRPCLSCLDGCLEKLFIDVAIHCAVNPEVGYEFERSRVKAPEKMKNVVIVGGGVAGMQAAVTAAERGHKVTILEASGKLGGQLNLASVPPHKHYIAKFTGWLEEELKRKGVEVKLNCKATVEEVKKYAPDEVLLATGSLPWVPEIPGIEKAVASWDILSGKAEMPEGKNVVMIGGGIVGCETALYLAQKENDITILEMLPDIAKGLDRGNKADIISDFKEKGICAFTSASITEIKDGEVVYEKDGAKESVAFDVLVTATGQRSFGGELKEALEDADLEVTVIGDATRPGKILNASEQGYFAGLNL